MKKSHIAFATALLAAFFLWKFLFASLPHGMENALAGMVEVKNVTTAFELFKTEFGLYPKGDNLEIAKVLFGENPKRIVFLENYNGRYTDSSGALADIWETALEIEVTAGERILIRSAGRDRVFWTADDVFLH